MEKIYEEIRKIARKYHIHKIVLFGSRARDDNYEKSDIDIAAYFEKGHYEREHASFTLEITEDIDTLYPIDVVCVNSKTDEKLKQNISEDGVLLYMKEKKFDQYKKAVSKVKEVTKMIEEERGNNNAVLQDALIQRFEFTFELAWKTIKDYLASQGVIEDISYPKSVLKKAFSSDIINDEKWLNILNDRNAASHIYSEDMAEVISKRIQSDYVRLFEELIEKLEDIIE
ncbi:MAG: HI0074 family nucleotidyltransferase substrate-binding subunit [Defluviitaleaceae bacterium]|nr:HI0074 family nucleotidyltransferase substrate-binding subunit [Defluviitaleaceae bacterium]